LGFEFSTLKNRPEIFLGAALLVAAVTLWFLRPQHKPIEFKSHIAIPGFQSSALVILAHEKGFFRDEGVEVTLEYKATGKDCLALVVAGKADLAVVFETPIVRSLLEGNKISVLTEIHRSEFNTAIVARKDRHIAHANDLMGKTVATTAKTNAEFHLDLYLRSHMVNPAKVKERQMPVGDAVRAVAAGEVDAAALWQPYVSQAIHDNPADFILLRSSFYSEFSMLAGMQEALQNKKDVSLALLRALLKAREYFETENREARAIVERILTEKNFFVSPTAWDQMDIQMGLSATLLTMFNVEADWYREQGDQSGIRKLDNIFAAAYLKEIAPELVTYE
jgi:ABC-type nitrate/sulfonate/bicarbonate transport system substrate-binding protein